MRHHLIPVIVLLSAYIYNVRQHHNYIYRSVCGTVFLVAVGNYSNEPSGSLRCVKSAHSE
jgi:hypothetical protein